MVERLVSPIPKSKSKRTPQQQRRTQWQKDYEAAQVVVRARSLGWCEVECDRRAEVFHHKKGRRAKDSNHPELILHVCNAHHLEIHANPERSYALGHLLRRT